MFIDSIKSYVRKGSNKFGFLSGNVLSSTVDLDMDDNSIENLSNPVSDQDAATKKYVDDQNELFLPLSGGAMSGDIAMGTNQITGLGDPTLTYDASNKNYVDLAISGVKQSDQIDDVRCVFTAGNTNLATLGIPSAAWTDGVTVVAGDRVVFYQQTTTAQNGIYIAPTAPDVAWVRSSDFDEASEITSRVWFLTDEGTLWAGKGWKVDSNPVTVGTDPIVFATMGALSLQEVCESGATVSNNPVTMTRTTSGVALTVSNTYLSTDAPVLNVTSPSYGLNTGSSFRGALGVTSTSTGVAACFRNTYSNTTTGNQVGYFYRSAGIEPNVVIENSTSTGIALDIRNSGSGKPALHTEAVSGTAKIATFKKGTIESGVSNLGNIYAEDAVPQRQIVLTKSVGSGAILESDVEVTTTDAPADVAAITFYTDFEGDFADSSATGLAATVNNAAVVSTSKYRNGSYSGFFPQTATKDWVSYPNDDVAENFNFGSGNFSIVFDMLMSEYPGENRYICGIIGGAPGSDSFAIRQVINAPMRIQFDLYTTDNPAVGKAAYMSFNMYDYINKWVQIAVVRDGNDIKMYLDGVLQSTTALGSALSIVYAPTIPFGLGGVHAGTQATSSKGYIDNFRVYKGTALSTFAAVGLTTTRAQVLKVEDSAVTDVEAKVTLGNAKSETIIAGNTLDITATDLEVGGVATYTGNVAVDSDGGTTSTTLTFVNGILIDVVVA